VPSPSTVSSTPGSAPQFEPDRLPIHADGSRARQAAIAAALDGDREDELLDALVAVAALVARADGRVQDVERAQLLDFLDQQGLLSAFGREDAELKFERCVRELREPGGLSFAIRRLQRHSESRTAAVALRVGDEVAAADCRLDPREERLLLLTRTVLGG
jgi:tellurite resistance protein